MKQFLILTAAILFSLQGISQKTPGKPPTSMPPGFDLEQIKKMLPPGTSLPPEMEKAMQQASGQTGSESTGYTPETLVPIPPAPQYSPVTQSSPTAAADYSPFGSGRNEGQRRLALIAVETELNAMSLILPDPNSVPSVEYMLGMAAAMNGIARQKFRPEDLSDYTAIVNWVPRFDGQSPNRPRAKELSLAVALATNNFPRPYHNIEFFSKQIINGVLSQL